MKKYITNILFFFVIVAGIDFCVGYIGEYLQSHAMGGMTRKTNDLVMKDQHDILIFGSSRAYHHYDAPFMSDSLGLDVFNAGYDGNGVILSYGLLSMILERYHPKLILFDIEPAFDIFEYAADNGNKRYITPLKPYYRNTEVSMVIKGVSEEEYLKCYSGMMRYNTSIISKALDFVQVSEESNKGYIPLKGAFTGEPKMKQDNASNIDTVKLAYVENLLVLAESKNIPIAVVASPKYGQKNANDLQPVIDICGKYHVPFIDFYANQKFMQHKEWFKEPMHLNDKGAKAFSREIVAQIKRLLRTNE
jgi:hypothetical protein